MDAYPRGPDRRVTSNILLTIVISVVLSYALLYIIQNIKGALDFPNR